MTIQQHLASTISSHSLATPTTWQARHDYRRAQHLACSLGLTECQARFIDPRPKSTAQACWGWYYPLASLLLLTVLFIGRFFAPAGMNDLITALFICLLVLLLPFALITLSFTLFRRARFHCEQIHLYANGFVAIDPRGRRQGIRFDQLFDFRRGAHEQNVRYGRIHWDTVRAAITHPQRGQAPTLKITPHLPDSLEICALIEQGYTSTWLPRFREQLASGNVLDFDALLLHCDWLGKTTPGQRRFSAAVPRTPSIQQDELALAPGMACGRVIQEDETTRIEWLRRAELKSLRVDDRFILIRTLEPVRRDNQGRADRLWFRVDTLGLKDAAILKALVPEYSVSLASLRTVREDEEDLQTEDKQENFE